MAKKITETDVRNTSGGGALAGTTRNGQTIIHKDGTLGGYLVGKMHGEGGIKAEVKGGQQIEMQGNEVVITAPAVEDKTKREFQGQMLTNRQILSKINEEGGGVSFADGGDVPTMIKTTGRKYTYGGKLMPDHDIVSGCGCQHGMAAGGKVNDSMLLKSTPLLIACYESLSDFTDQINPKFLTFNFNAANSENLPSLTTEKNKAAKFNSFEELEETENKLESIGFFENIFQVPIYYDNLKSVHYVPSHTDADYTEYQEFLEKRDKHLLENFSTGNYAGGGTISDTTMGELDKAQRELKQGLELQDKMKKANTIIKAGKDVTNRLMAIGFSQSNAEKLQTKDFAGRIGFASYQLTNNNASNKRLQDRVNLLQQKIAASEKAAATGEPEKYEFDTAPGGYIEINYPEDRVQIFFNEKISRNENTEMYEKLKSGGWNFSYRNEAWQRKITPQAINAAVYMTKATKVKGNTTIENPVADKPVKRYGIEDIEARNFTYVSIYLHGIFPAEFTGATTLNLVYFGLNTLDTIEYVKNYVVQKLEIPEDKSDKVIIRCYPKTYIKEAKELFNRGAYLPQPDADPEKLLAPTYKQLRNFRAMTKDFENNPGKFENAPGLLTLEQFKTKYAKYTGYLNEQGDKEFQLNIQLPGETEYYTLYSRKQNHDEMYLDFYESYLHRINKVPKPAPAAPSLSSVGPVKLTDLLKVKEERRFKNMSDYITHIETTTGKKLLDFTEDQIIEMLNKLPGEQLVGSGSKKNRVQKAAQMMIYHAAKNVPDNQLTLEQFAIKKFIGGAYTEAAFFSEPLVVFTESFRKEWEKAKEQVPEKVMIPNYMVDDIKNSIALGYDEIKEGMISPNKRGIMLVNKNSQVMGTYPLEIKSAVQQIIDEESGKGIKNVSTTIETSVTKPDGTGTFIYGRGFNVPTNYGALLMLELIKKGFKVRMHEHSIDIEKKGNSIYVNDNGGEFNLGEIKNNRIHISNIPYDITGGPVKPAKLANDITADFDNYYFMDKETSSKLPTRAELIDDIHTLDMSVRFVDNDGKERLMRKFQFSKVMLPNIRSVIDLGVKEQMKDTNYGMEVVLSFLPSMEGEIEKAYRALTNIKTTIPYEEKPDKVEPKSAENKPYEQKSNNGEPKSAENEIDTEYDLAKGRQLMFIWAENEDSLKKKFDFIKADVNGDKGELYLVFSNGHGTIDFMRNADIYNYNETALPQLQEIKNYLLNLAKNYVYKLTPDQQKALFKLSLEPNSYVLLPKEYFDKHLKELEGKSLLYETASPEKFPNTEVRLTDNGKKFIKNYEFDIENQFTGLLAVPVIKADAVITGMKFFKGIDNQYKNPYELNKAIEEFVDTVATANSITPAQKQFLSYYSGYGGLEKFGASGKGLLYEYFTPSEICKRMWGLAYRWGYKGGRFLEPSVGVGEFFKYAPNAKLGTAFEINEYSYKIFKLLYPEATITLASFESLFIKNNKTIKDKIDGLAKFDLVIGNPPYGDYNGFYAAMGEKNYTKAENWIDYFIFRSLDLLKKDGLLIFIIGTEVANGGTPWLQKEMTKAKQLIAEKADLVDAYRLPNGVFERTDVLSDIIVLRKK